jgi:hypothetical protein
MVEDFEQDDFDMIDPSAKRVLVALSQFEKGLLVTVRHLSKSKLINIPEPEKRHGPYDFNTVEITDFGRQVLAKFR